MRSLPSSWPSRPLLLFGLVGCRHTGDRDFLRYNRLDRLGEGHLYRPTHLTGVDAGRHHRAKGPDVEEVAAHKVAQADRLLLVLRIELGLLGGFLVTRPLGQIGLAVLLVQDGALLHVDIEAGGAVLGELNIVAHLALETHVRNKPMIGFGVEPGQIAGIGVAVRVASQYIEQQHEIVAVGERGHLTNPYPSGRPIRSFSV